MSTTARMGGTILIPATAGTRDKKDTTRADTTSEDLTGYGSGR